MNEQQLAQYRQLATAGENNVAMCSEYQQAITALLAMVERLTARAEEAEALLAGSPADTLAWALDKREQELREARCEVERLTGENANAKAALVAAAALLHQSNAEVERLTGELAAAQQEAAQVRRAGATKLMQADAEIDALRAELAAERSIMNMVPEYIQYLSKWRAGDGTFLLFNEWVAQRIAQPQA